jgi:hypothetical protein
MGWFDYHLWEFTIGKQKYGLPTDDDWRTESRIAAGKVRLRDDSSDAADGPEMFYAGRQPCTARNVKPRDGHRRLPFAVEPRAARLEVHPLPVTGILMQSHATAITKLP